MDIKNAFLHGKLEEEVFMKLPPSHPQGGDPNLVCKLHKSIYGSKQSTRACHVKLSSTLEMLGFSKSFVDSSLHVRLGKNDKLMLMILLSLGIMLIQLLN